MVYLLDTHGGANALHIFALTNFGKNVASYGSSFFANGIVESRGVTISMYILAACEGFCFVCTIPMYIFGKRVRSFVRDPSSSVDICANTNLYMRRLPGIHGCLRRPSEDTSSPDPDATDAHVIMLAGCKHVTCGKPNVLAAVEI